MWVRFLLSSIYNFNLKFYKFVKYLFINKKLKSCTKTSGKKNFQPTCINWSNLNLGKFALTKMNKNVIIIVFNRKNEKS